MKRHLKRFKQLLTLTLLVIGFSQTIVSEVYSQTINNPIGVNCDCQGDLPEGWKVMNISFTGTGDTNFVIGSGFDIYNLDQTALTFPHVLTETAPGTYSVSIVANTSGLPSVGIGYENGGVYTQLQNLVSFPASCSISTVSISPSNETACLSSMNTVFTATIPADNPAVSYQYSYTFSVNDMPIPAGMTGSGSGIYNFPQGITNPTAGVYTIEVVAEQFDLGGVTTGCTYTDMAVMTVYDLSEMVSVIGDIEVCDTGLPTDYYLNIDDFANGQTLDWNLKDDLGAVVGNFPSTGSGTSIDFTGQPVGNYSICVSGITDDACVFNTEFEVAVINPGGEIIGATDVVCGNIETYTVSPVGGVTAGTVWTVTGGVITDSDDSTATVEWDMAVAGSISASGVSGDGCSYTIINNINFLDSSAAFTLEGDTYVCSGDLGVYSITGSGVSIDNFTYAWTLFDAMGTDISASPCPLLDTTNDGQSQPMDFSCLAPGDYSLTVDATSTNGCPDFTMTIPITVADPADISSIACVSGGLNVTIGNSCTLEVTADLILQGAGSVNNDAYDIVLVDVESGELIVGNILDHSYINKEIEVKVIDQCTGNSCWGYITVEDKSIPALVCPAISDPLDCMEAADKTLEAYMPIFDAGVTVTYNGNENWTLDGYDNCGEATLTCEDVDQSMGECTNPRFITRIWTVTDEYGATSTCAVDLTVIFDEANFITYPSDYDDVIPGAEPSIDVCSNYPTDATGNPHPSFTGSPEAGSCVEIIVIGYTDTNLEICGGNSPARKVIREWVIWSQCGNGGLGEEIYHTQYITLTDTAPPICAAFDEFAVVTAGHDCGASIFVPQPEVSNECGTVYIDMTYKLRDDNGIIPALFSDEGVTYDPITRGFTIEDVSFISDSLWILFEVRDGCGNGTTDCLTEIALIDNTPPTPVCDLFNNIALNADGKAYAGPSTFDDHSYDNCDVYQTVIKRMDEGAACGTTCATPRYDFLNYLGEYDGHLYYMSKTPTTGPKSFAYANAIESYVATIETEAEGTWLHDQVTTYSNASYFIGYQGVGITNASTPVNSDFDAQSGGVMNYDNWATGEPNWSLGGTGDLYVNVQADGTWAAERESASSHYYIVEVEDPCVFSQQVEFCCADVGNDVQVRMRVFDAHGNFAECMVMVTVQDFKAPTVTNVPANLSLDCEELVNTDYLLGAASDSLFNYGAPTFSDNCSFVLDYTVDISTATNCGSFDITRNWVATDPYGNSTSRTQTITVGELTPFVGDSIVWPLDFDSQNCNSGVHPDELPNENAYPTYLSENGCSNLTSAYEDQVFNYTEVACSKILRTWTVIDWCQPNEEWVHVQVIKIFDSVAPTIVSGCQNLTEVEGELVGNCMIETWETGLGLTLSDNCSNYDQVTVWYDLDLDNDGIYEVTGVQSDNANGVYPFGTHAIKWYAVDDCGNEMDPCSMTFVVDGESDGPTAYCLTEVVTTIPLAGVAEIWAKDFDQGSFTGTCNENDSLIFSFSADTTNQSQSFDCSDLPAGVTDTLELQMWVTDSNGRQSYCTTYLILQDNHGQCDQEIGARADISGKVYTEEGEMVDNVQMSLMAGEADPMMTYMTQEGEYDFVDVPMYSNYEINAYNNENPLNGVSTLDIVLIQRHILGLSLLDSPYKVIAADANNSSSVSALDLIVIRKLILGLSDEYPGNDSWRFVDQEFVFADQHSPWPFNENLYLNDLDQNMIDEDFIAVKIGDVNNTVIANFASSPVESRNETNFGFGIETSELENGNTKVELTAGNDGNFIGTQFSLSLEGAELLNVIPGMMELDENHFTIAEGELLVSFDAVSGVRVSKDEVLFALELSKGETVSLTETLRPEVYVDGNSGVEVMGIELDAAKAGETVEFLVYQNTPNPFSEETTIAFELPSSGVVNIQIFDNSGKVLFADSGNFNRGYNEFSIQQSDLQSTGILYYQISTDTQIATRKMIVLK